MIKTLDQLDPLPLPGAPAQPKPAEAPAQPVAKEQPDLSWAFPIIWHAPEKPVGSSRGMA